MKYDDLEDYRSELAEFVVLQSVRGDSGVRFCEQTRLKLAEWKKGPKAQAFEPSGKVNGTGAREDLGPERTDPVDVWERQYANAWRQIQGAMRDIRNIDATVRARADRRDRTTNDSRAHVCANQYCRDNIPTPNGATPVRGRCEPCLAYLEKHDKDAGPAIIADRRRKREQRSVRVSSQVVASMPKM